MIALRPAGESSDITAIFGVPGGHPGCHKCRYHHHGHGYGMRRHECANFACRPACVDERDHGTGCGPSGRYFSPKTSPQIPDAWQPLDERTAQAIGRTLIPANVREAVEGLGEL